MQLCHSLSYVAISTDRQGLCYHLWSDSLVAVVKDSRVFSALLAISGYFGSNFVLGTNV